MEPRNSVALTGHGWENPDPHDPARCEICRVMRGWTRDLINWIDRAIMGGTMGTYPDRTAQQRLAHLVEELAEAITAAGKLMRWGPGSINPELPQAMDELRQVIPEAGKVAPMLVSVLKGQHPGETNAQWLVRELQDVRLTARAVEEDLGLSKLVETGWLLELDGEGGLPAWWDGTSFTTNHLEAVRFVRAEDANRVVKRIIPELHPRLRATEHAWADGDQLEIGTPVPAIAELRGETPITVHPVAKKPGHERCSPGFTCDQSPATATAAATELDAKAEEEALAFLTVLQSIEARLSSIAKSAEELSHKRFVITQNIE